MSRLILVVLGTAMGAICLQGQAISSPSTPAVSPQRALVNRYCVTCHNTKLKTGGLTLDKFDVDKVAANPEIWENVDRKLRSRVMPPTGLPRPDGAAYDSFATYLETALDSAAATHPNPGRPGIHRLNRAEYANAIRDLLGLDLETKAMLPADDSGYGFDNIGDVLSFSPLLLDRYLSAARQVSRLAIGDPTLHLPTTTYEVSQRLWQNDQESEDLPLGSRGGAAISHYFPLDAEYVLTIRLKNTFAFGTAIGGMGSPHQLDVRLDGAKLKLFTLGGTQSAGGAKPETGEKGLEMRLHVKAGTHLIGISFLNESSLKEGMLKPPLIGADFEDWSPTTGNPGVASIAVSGPTNIQGSGDTPSRKKIFVCHPTSPQSEEPCARQILSGLARRAYRRPVSQTDVDALLGYYRDGRRQKRDFEAAIGMALEGMLISPEFLFRIEQDPPNVAPGTPYRVSDIDLASRLSFFLWSSPPDEELLGLAEHGKLKDKKVFEQQVSRMLADSRSKALIDNFMGQWLGLRGLPDALPDRTAFPDFDDSLKEAFQTEANLFLTSMVREDHSVLDLLDANYTFVNERLARHYGIPNIYGSRFRRVVLTDESRWGLLGKGALLTITALPNRTSPVVRGKWVLENILGAPPPPPPPNVPPLKEGKDVEHLTMRQRMEQHRANPVCASCHSRMDPIGFSMENFNAIGEWRTKDGENPIDVSGVLPDGTKFKGSTEMQKSFLNRPDLFASTVTEKLLTYALGRGVEYYDEPVIRSIMRETAPSRYRWSAIILAIVKSGPFQMATSQEPTATAAVHASR